MLSKSDLDQDIDDLVGEGFTQRETAFGGAYDGASRFEKQIAGWAPPLQSADADMLPSKYMLDARARDVGRNDAYIQGGAMVHKDSIVGGMFMLNSKPAHTVLGKTEDWAEAFQQEVETLWTLWAESPMNWVDASRQNDFTSLVRLMVSVYVFGGEALATAEWITQQNREFRTAVQVVDCDRLSTPYEQVNNPRVRGGILHDAYGAPVTAYIQIKHPFDYRGLLAGPDMFWKPVRFAKPWGRQQVIYIREQNRAAQTRAVADIAAGLREIAITRKFRDVTLQNAVVNAMYAATIESELPSEVAYAQIGGGMKNQITDYATSFLSAVSEYVASSKNMQLDGVKVPHLFPGTKLNLHPAGTPGGVGQDFEHSLLRYIATALGISYEELSKDYTKTNYSSARAALNQTWKFMQSRKRVVADRFANTVFRLWLEEAVNTGKLESFPASEAGNLYTNGHLNHKFDALAKAVWIGAARGQIDELKETQAAVLRIKYGLSTHEDELSKLGKDWRHVFAQLEREKTEMRERNIVLEEDDNMMNAASGTPRKQDEESGNKAEVDEE
jgi:lambda family phage portal protein